MGKIVFGLYGETVPKTVKNFVEICKGGHYVHKSHHARRGKTGILKTIDQLDFYFVELMKINPLDLFRDPIHTLMEYLTKVMVGRPDPEL